MKPASDDTPPKQGLGSSHHGKHDGGEVIKVGVENDKGGLVAPQTGSFCLPQKNFEKNIISNFFVFTCNFMILHFHSDIM